MTTPKLFDEHMAALDPKKPVKTLNLTPENWRKLTGLITHNIQDAVKMEIGIIVLFIES